MGRYTPYDQYFAPQQLQKVLLPVAYGGTIQLTNATKTFTANDAYGVRAVAPCGGKLKAFTIYNGATAAGNLKGSIYTISPDSTTATKVWTSAVTAASGTAAFQSLGDPDIVVTQGDQLDLVIAAADATHTFGRVTLSNVALATLPASYAQPIGASVAHSVKLAWTKATEYASPSATLTEANRAANADAIFIMCRIDTTNY